MENEKIIKSIRGPKETFEKLANVAKEQGIDQGAALEALLNCWSIQQAKGEIPGRAADIADFDAAIQQVQRAFLRSLELAQGAESRARASYQAQLDVYAGKVAQLEKDVANWKELYNTKDKLYKEATAKAENLQNRVAELTKRGEELEAQIKLKEMLENLTKAAKATKATKTTKAKATKAVKDDETSQPSEPQADEPPQLKVIARA